MGTYTLTAIGDGPTVTWSLDGTDKSDFMLEGTGMSRMLKFSSAPDYEAPADADSDNTYMVTVKASAGGEMEMVDVTVNITDVDENVAPAFPSPQRSIGEYGGKYQYRRPGAATTPMAI